MTNGSGRRWGGVRRLKLGVGSRVGSAERWVKFGGDRTTRRPSSGEKVCHEVERGSHDVERGGRDGRRRVCRRSDGPSPVKIGP